MQAKTGIIRYMKKRGRMKFHQIKTWQLLVVLVPLLFVDATLLRMDHIRMTELRDAVLAADASENDAGTGRAKELCVFQYRSKCGR